MSERLTEIPTRLADYPLLRQVLEETPGPARSEAHERILGVLDELIRRRGEEEVVRSRRPQRDGQGRVVGEWVGVGAEIRDLVSRSVQVWAEDTLGYVGHLVDEDPIEVEVRRYSPGDIGRLGGGGPGSG